jgi:CspA family cold shock protein
LLTDGKLVTIMETWREGVLIGGPSYQRWGDSLTVDPLTEKDVVDLDHEVRHYSGTKGRGVAYTNDQFGTRLLDGVSFKGDNLRSELITLGAEAHHARLIAEYPRGASRPPQSSAPRIAGVVKWVDNKKGFGFITTAGGDDVFFHVSAVETSSAGRLRDAASVTFEMRTGQKGPVAIAVRITD